MPTAGLSRRPWWTRERPDRQLLIGATRFSTGAVAIVLTVALLMWLLAPESWQTLIEDEQRTDATALTIISIWANNLLVCSLPVLAGLFAHRLVQRGRRHWARAVIALAGLAVLRSLLVIGLVGGLDPAWLAGAAEWWVFETTALGTCCAAGWQAFRETDSIAVSRQLAHALAFAGAVLALAAGVEVAST